MCATGGQDRVRRTASRTEDDLGLLGDQSRLFVADIGLSRRDISLGFFESHLEVTVIDAGGTSGR